MNKNLLNLLFIDYVSCQIYVMDDGWRNEYGALWSNTDSEKHKNSEKSLSLCFSAHHKSEGSGLGFKLGASGMRVRPLTVWSMARS